MNAQTLHDRLAPWAAATLGTSQVSSVQALPGHAGLGFRFDVSRDGGIDRYVIRMAPPGVRRSGSTDVLRQVPLLRGLERAGFPVARVIWASSEEEFFGTDAYVQEFLPGAPLSMEKDANVDRPPQDVVHRHVASAVDALAQLHSLDWQQTVPGWQTPSTLVEDVAFWDALRPKMWDERSIDAAGTLATRLRATAPSSRRIGIFHGDFHTSNIIFAEDASINGVLDWELSGIGAQLLDIAWLSLFTDPACWAPEHDDRMGVAVDPEWLYELYCERTGADRLDLNWFKAFACFRFAVIIGVNLRLHRLGRRIDPFWDGLASSVDALIARGELLLDDPRLP